MGEERYNKTKKPVEEKPPVEGGVMQDMDKRHKREFKETIDRHTREHTELYDRHRRELAGTMTQSDVTDTSSVGGEGGTAGE